MSFLFFGYIEENLLEIFIFGHGGHLFVKAARVMELAAAMINPPSME
jgi:hypothetical protein